MRQYVAICDRSWLEEIREAIYSHMLLYAPIYYLCEHKWLAKASKLICNHMLPYAPIYYVTVINLNKIRSMYPCGYICNHM